jgi:hypothetical protein
MEIAMILSDFGARGAKDNNTQLSSSLSSTYDQDMLSISLD